jgi:hypothetical protein
MGTGARKVEVEDSAHVVTVGGRAQQGRIRTASRLNGEKSENRIYP